MAVFDAEIIQTKIDSHFENNQEDGRRSHLGGSLIGRECLRELWYGFRWATQPKFSGRILRLFRRGHKEEFSFVEYLRSIGCEVRDYSQRLMYHDASDSYTCIDWDDTNDRAWAECDDVSDDQGHIERAEARNQGPEQWRISDVFGHFGGSLDGIGYNLPEIILDEGITICPEDPFLLEFKTHGQKSFDTLVKKGLRASKPEHYAQMQTYMLKRGLKFGLYMAVNKNTDELKCYFITAEPIHGAALISKAAEVITAPLPPKRISNNPSWFKCRFCDHRKPCHMGEPMQKNCRTCVFSKPVDDGQWFCSKWGANIPKEAQKEGCPSYTAIDNG